MYVQALESLHERYPERVPVALGPWDACPVCHQQVGFHRQAPLAPAPRPASPRPRATGLDPLSAENRRDLGKLLKDLPKWDKHRSSCREFLEEIERVLGGVSTTPRDHWFHVLPLLFPGDAAAAKWTQDHIVGDMHTLDWETACRLFRDHFERADHLQSLQLRYQRCRQASHETSQEYGDRFTALSGELRVPDDSPEAIAHFVNHSTPRMRSKFNNMLAMLRVTNPEAAYDLSASLDRVIRACVELDYADQDSDRERPAAQPAPSAPARAAGAGAGARRGGCSYHPGANHTTAECISGPRRAAAARPFAPPSGQFAAPPAARTVSAKPGVVCYACQQPGHYKSDPKCPKFGQNPSPPGQGAGPRQTAFAVPAASRAAAPGGNAGAFLSTRMVSEAAPGGAADAEAQGDLDRTLPLVCMVSSCTEDAVYLHIQSGLCRAFLDTGSDVSLMRPGLAQRLGLPTEPSTGQLQLAVAGTTADKGLRTLSLPVTAVFHCPGSQEEATPPRSLDGVRFELMELSDMGHGADILLGMDVLTRLFPAGQVPLRFCRQRRAPGPAPARAAPAGQAVRAVLRLDAAAAAVAEPSPAAEPEVGTFTRPDKAQEFALHQERLWADPAIRAALSRNEAFTGFCHLPEAVLRLVVRPDVTAAQLRRRQYRIEQQLVPRVDAVIARWLGDGKICLAPPGCAYNNPLVVAPKKDEAGNLCDIRVCLDTRALNDVLVNEDCHPLPYIRVALEKFGGCVMFGEFDLSEAYLQFPLAEESRPLTAFTWGDRQYMFVGCPFGLSVLPSHFQRVMMYVMQDLTFTFPYMDNLPFASATWEQHRDQALAIIERLNSVHLRIKPASVKFGQSHIRCLGHLISAAGVGVDPKKLASLRDWPLPATAAQLQTFLGFVTFLRQHVRHFADLTAPLEAVKLSKDLVWTEHLTASFEATKAALMRAPFLQYPDYSRPFHIATDASNAGVGGVLYQPSAPDEQVTATNIVAICSKVLNKAQRNYSPYKKEAWGVVYCLRQFRPYVWGRDDLTVVTDHKPLTYILATPELPSAIRMWMDDILDFRFRIVHRPGVLNVLPDALSRMYAERYPEVWGVPGLGAIDTVPDVEPQLVAPVTTRARSAPARIPKGGGGAAASPPAPPPPTSAPANPPPVEGGPSEPASPVPPPEAAEAAPADAPAPEELLPTLLAEMERRGMTTPPAGERLPLVRKEHLLGHFGREATYRSLFNRGLWWPAMRADIQTVVADCDACNRFVVVKAGYNPAQFIHATGPWLHVQIDSSVHLPQSPDGYTALLVIIDVFTGYVVLRPMRTTSAEAVARKLWKVFCTLGLPRILQSDNGPEFVNDTLRALVKLTGLDHRLISPYNPRADGKVERAIGSVMAIIKKLLHGSERHWPLFVPFAQFAFNRKVAVLTGSSPFSLMFGRGPGELEDHTREPPAAVSLADWQSHQEKIAALIYPAVNARVLGAKDRMVAALDKHRRVLLAEKIPAGAIVMLRDPTRKDKFEPKYVGPYTVVRRAHNGAFVLRDATGDILDRHVPLDQLKLIARRARPKDRAGDVWEIDHVTAHRGDAGSYEYRVRWKGFAAADDTWEPADSFLDDAAIRAYWRNRAAPAAPRL